jgi:hypothetical protein
MHLHSETPPLTGSIVRNGGNGISKAVTAKEYSNAFDNSITEYAAAKVATRCRLTISTAREVCRMAGLAVPS